MTYVLRRYSNRRLYDPQQARNVTLDEVSELVREGRKVKIVDSSSGDDLTLRVLGQTFLYTLKGWKNDRKSLEVLKVLISEGGESSMDILKKTILTSLGAFEVTKQKAEEIIDHLIQKGEVSSAHRADAVVELLDKAQESTKGIRNKISDEITSAIEKIKVAKKKDLEVLEAKVDKLIVTVEKIEGRLKD